MNLSEHISSDEFIPARISDDEKKFARRYLRDRMGTLVPIWDIKEFKFVDSDSMAMDYSFISYDSEGKTRRYLTQSAHQSSPFSLEDGDTIDIGYQDIKDYLSTHK